MLKIGGITPLTSIDYPDELAAVIFCMGCPWRCRYCQNKQLLKYGTDSDFYWPEILDKLRSRVGLLDAVVFSGGEPVLQQAALLNAIRDIKSLGFKAGLHTAGCYPDKLEKLLDELDWVGLDIKAPADVYPLITGVPESGYRAWKSLQLIQASNTDFEVRVTVHNELLNEEHLLILLQHLADLDIPKLALQQCRPDNMLDASSGFPQSEWQNSKCVNFAEQHFKSVELRT